MILLFKVSIPLIPIVKVNIGDSYTFSNSNFTSTDYYKIDLKNETWSMQRHLIKPYVVSYSFYKISNNYANNIYLSLLTSSILLFSYSVYTTD